MCRGRAYIGTLLNTYLQAMKEIGNIKANQHWNPDERKNPIPANMEESERDSELEQYIRGERLNGCVFGLLLNVVDYQPSTNTNVSSTSQR